MTGQENAVIHIDAARRELELATDPPAIMEVEAKLDAIENYMRQAGLYSTEEIRPVNETKMRARWMLGKALAKVERGQGARTDLTLGAARPKFNAYIKSIGLAGTAAKEAQRIGALPEPDLEKTFAEMREQDILNTYVELIGRARPYWYQESRRRKHREIKAVAETHTDPEHVGPFPLIYADPPWTFKVYSEKGKHKTAEQHYPTLTDEEIIDLRLFGKTVPEIAHNDAALFMWCTSSNVHRALVVLDGWGFTFKSSAVWVKDKSGLGLVFRNQHEVLLYGTRGKMPGPLYQPPSVFHAPRSRHSEKPAIVREAIEKMYPQFDKESRLEMFAREAVNGWTVHGYES